MSPLQRYYLPSYLETGFLSTMRQSSEYQLVTVADRQYRARPVTEVDVQFTVNMDNGKSVSFDPKKMRHFDHGYAVNLASAF